MMFSPGVLFTFSLISLSVQQQDRDPLKDFCRIFGHQTAVVDRNLLIDGGLVNWGPITTESENYTSTWLRNGELDNDNLGFPQQVTLPKNQSVPSVHGGVLWPDNANKIVYQYGGEYGNGDPDDFKLWYYDVIYKTWNVSDARATDIKRASWGAGATNQDGGIGYYYGGWLTNASVPGYGAPTPLSHMVVYDMKQNTLRNMSGPDMTPRAEGVLLYVPAGDNGMLVYFGGLEFPGGNRTGMNMTDIHIYNIGDNLWYKQKASGQVPEPRRRFCAGLAYAEDRSSYNIYLYGGASIGDGVGYGDVYILSLPSFTWIKFWPRPEDNQGSTFPHHSLSCDVLGNSQMIIMGGHFTNMTDQCDVPAVYGQHGLDLGKNNEDGAAWAAYRPNLTTYRVPGEITKTIGGGAEGKATLTAPTGGWQERDLQVQFQRAFTPEARTPTRPIPTPTGESDSDDNKTSNGAVIGGAIGGVAAVLIVGSTAFCVFWRRRKAKMAQQMDDQKNRRISELPSDHPKSPEQYTSPSQTRLSPHGSPNNQENGWSAWAAPAPEYPGHPGHAPHFQPDVKHASYIQEPQELPATQSFEPVEMPASPYQPGHDKKVIPGASSSSSQMTGNEIHPAPQQSSSASPKLGLPESPRMKRKSPLADA